MKFFYQGCNGLVLLLKTILRLIHMVQFLLTIVACNFCSARCSCHGKIIYNFHNEKLPITTIVVGF